MKKFLSTITFALAVLSAIACKHPTKEKPNAAVVQNIATTLPAKADEITKEVYTDNFGDQMEVAINETQGTISIRLDGKTYELTKNEEMPEYTASNAEYLYSNIRGNVTFLKRNIDMVLFRSKQNEKVRASTKMASY